MESPPPAQPDDPTDDPTHERGSGVRRRALLAGAGLLGAGAIGAVGFGLGRGEGAPGLGRSGAEVRVSITEMATARGDWTVWTVGYELEEGEEAPWVYTPEAQQARHEALQAKKAEQTWTAAEPLLVLDPYGTTLTGLYVYLEDAAAGGLSFTCASPLTPDLTATAANHASTGFEGLVVGLVPGALTTVELSWEPDGGTATAGEVLVDAPATASGYGTQLAADVADLDALSAGLFALSGVSGAGDNTYLVDNHGVLRAEVPGLTPSHRFVVEGGRLVLATTAYQVTVLDPLGHAVTVVDTGRQKIHHDVVAVGDVAYALTSDMTSERVEDRVVRIDLATGDVVEVVDLQLLLGEYEALAHTREGGNPDGEVGKDWIHINSIDVVDGVMYLSARETSTIIALDDALEEGSTPSVRWMIGVESLWEGTGYEELFLDGVADPTGNAGQHTVTRLDDDALPPGQYYLEMFNNNWWDLGTREEEVWADVGPTGSSRDAVVGTSHVLRYLVDEETGTFTEDLAVEVPYSSVVSSVWRLGARTVDSSMVVNSGEAKEFSERTADGTALARYRYDASNLGYRVYKQTFEGFWYAGA